VLDPQRVRAQLIQNLETLSERYPQLRLGQILSNAIGVDLYYVSDEDLARGLNQLFISYTQFEAAGIERRKV
jgi:hypothetical protein